MKHIVKVAGRRVLLFGRGGACHLCPASRFSGRAAAACANAIIIAQRICHRTSRSFADRIRPQTRTTRAQCVFIISNQGSPDSHCARQRSALVGAFVATLDIHAIMPAYLCQMWTKLAKMRDDLAPPAERLAFAHKHLLGKTLAMVGQMEVRPLANVLWALGSLRLDLTEAEPLGPYLAEQLEGRIRQLVADGALKDDRHTAQLWYGMYFCKYPWPRQLLRRRPAAPYGDHRYQGTVRGEARRVTGNGRH